MKAYTDIEQSKKLAEILPLESADNVIVSFGSREGTKIVVMPKETLDVIRTPFADIRETTMCWSLAALLGALHNYTMINNGYSGIVILSSYCHSDEHDNPIDACYDLILKLNKM